MITTILYTPRDIYCTLKYYNVFFHLEIDYKYKYHINYQNVIKILSHHTQFILWNE